MRGARRIGTAAVLLLAACGGGPAPAPVIPDMALGDSAATRDSVPRAPGGNDPVGFLLERKDSLGLSQEVVDRLVQINLDLFRRNARLQTRMDSIAPPMRDETPGGRRGQDLTPGQRDLLRPLLAARADNIRRAGDAAQALLSPEQQERSRVLYERERQRMMRNRRP